MMPTPEATTATDDLLIEAADYAKAAAPGNDASAGIDRLGTRLLYIKKHLPEWLDRFAAQRGAEPDPMVAILADRDAGDRIEARAPQMGGGERYRHKKRGTTYQVVGVASSQVVGEPIGEGSKVVVYRAENGPSWDLWVRPYDEFHDGRFEYIGGPQTGGGDLTRWRGAFRAAEDDDRGWPDESPQTGGGDALAKEHVERAFAKPTPSETGGGVAGERAREEDIVKARAVMIGVCTHEERIQHIAAALRDSHREGADLKDDVRRGGPEYFRAALQESRRQGYREGAEAMRETAAQTADSFTCGGCGMDGKAGAAIRALPIPE